MEIEQKNSDRKPDDAIAQEKSISFSRKSDVSEEEISRIGSGEEEVFIKPDLQKPNIPANRTWSPRKDAFFFSKFVSFL